MFPRCVNKVVYYCSAGECNTVVWNWWVSNQFGVERSKIKTCKNEFYGRTTRVHHTKLFKSVQREFDLEYPDYNAPSKSTISRLVKKFHSKECSVSPHANCSHKRNVRNCRSCVHWNAISFASVSCSTTRNFLFNHIESSKESEILVIQNLHSTRIKTYGSRKANCVL